MSDRTFYIQNNKLKNTADTIKHLISNPEDLCLIFNELYNRNGIKTKVIKNSEFDFILTENDLNHVIDKKIICLNKLNKAADEVTTAKALTKLESLSKSYNNEYDYFIFISIDGFITNNPELNVFEYEQFNMEMRDIGYIRHILDKHFNCIKKEDNAFVELTAYNNYVYRKIIRDIDILDKTCAIQPTGSGKSYLIGALAAKHFQDRVLIFTSSNFIIEQFYKSFPWMKNKDYIRIFTYAKTLYLSDEEKQDLIDFNASYQYLDEFHRCGAECWNEHLKIIESLSNIKKSKGSKSRLKKIGVTATPVRNLDSRDMSEELFDNNISNYLTLSEAIVLKILPSPIYVTSFYEVNTEANKLASKVSNCAHMDANDKKIAKELLDNLKKDFDGSLGIPNILKKHITYQRKFIVFCENISHLREMKPIVKQWFKTAFGASTPVHTYEIHSETTNSKLILDEFVSCSSGFSLLFGVQSISEGVHSNSIQGTIHLRFSTSEILVRQQQGRVFTGYSKETPIIFDFVNNIKTISSIKFEDQIKKSHTKISSIRQGLNLNPIEESKETYIKKIYDETHDTLELFKSIEESLKIGWESFFIRLCKYYNTYGHTDLPKEYDYSLYNWCIQQRVLYKADKLSPERVRKLNSIKFIWDVLMHRWMGMFNSLKAYYKKHGHCKVTKAYDKKLFNWTLHTRKCFHKGILSKEQIALLKSIEYPFNVSQENWDKMILKLVEYKSIHGHIVITAKNASRELSNWCINTRKRDLTPEQRKVLEDLGFPFDLRKALWDLRCSQLLEYKSMYGDTLVPRSYENKDLAKWVIEVRRLYSKGALTQSKIDQLNSYDFIWDPATYTWNLTHSEFSEAYSEIDDPKHLKKRLTPPLYRWMLVQRKKFKDSKLPDEKYQMLKEIDFPFS